MSRPNLIAPVLTFDRNAVVTRHMVARYEALWPGHPFTFRIPYQDRAAVSEQPRCELVESPPDIQGSMRALLAGLDDDAWIYWCIDDKYPVRLDLERIEPLVAAIRDGVPSEIAGVLFCRARRMLEPAFLTDDRRSLGNQSLIGRRSYHQIWIHQFLRVRVLRTLFASFPEVLASPRLMDDMIETLGKPGDLGLFVTETSLAAFGESTTRGVLTRNCLASMVRHGFPVPSWQPDRPADAIHIGVERKDQLP